MVGDPIAGARVAALAAVKLGVVAGLWTVGRAVPECWRVDIPVGLALVGGAATAWNLAVLLLVW